MVSWFSRIRECDEELLVLMEKELERQRSSIELIPSENFTSEAVMQAMGSILTNKYSEGYPKKRYYGGNEFIDQIEIIAENRAKKLFNVEYANVQPYSGSPANMEVYLALCKPGDTIMGQSLTSGGHLTHGWNSSATGQLFKSVQYGVTEDGYINIDEVRRLAEENKPKLIWVGSTAYVRKLPFKEFSEIAESIGAYLAADISHISGLVIAGVHESPEKYVDVITTTTHKTLRGPRGAIIMATKKGLEKDPDLPSKLDKSVFPGMQGGPHDNVVAAIAIALKQASTQEFKVYANQIVFNAKTLARSLMDHGIKLVTNGTDNHMILADLTDIAPGLGIFAQEALDISGITLNKNTVPGERSSAFYPSGIRMGTPAVTSRGMKETQMKQISEYISNILEIIKDSRLPDTKEERLTYIKKFKEDIKNNNSLLSIRSEVASLANSFPLYPEMNE
ncbi:MAG: serine hydroxymethyltransferase [Candidatus Micrarchaeia archaeon]